MPYCGCFDETVSKEDAGAIFQYGLPARLGQNLRRLSRPMLPQVTQLTG